MNIIAAPAPATPWNKGKLVGQKSPLRLHEIYGIRIRLQLAHRTRDLALLNLAVNSKVRACDLTRLRVQDISHGGQIQPRAIVMQQKAKRPVQFEIPAQTRESLQDWIQRSGRIAADYLFPSSARTGHLSTRQYARIVHGWVRDIGLDVSTYGTHSLRRSNAALIYRRMHNLRAVQLLLGHTQIESTVR